MAQPRGSVKLIQELWQPNGGHSNGWSQGVLRPTLDVSPQEDERRLGHVRSMAMSSADDGQWKSTNQGLPSLWGSQTIAELVYLPR